MKKFYIVVFLCILLTPLTVNVITNPLSLSVKYIMDSTIFEQIGASLLNIRNILEVDSYCKNFIAEADYRLWNSSIAANTFIGRNGYIFTKNDIIVDSIMGQHVASEHIITKICESQQQIHDKLKKRGVHYILALAPEKWEIYEEQLPWYMKKHGNNRSVREQVVNALRMSTDVAVIDFTEALQQEKNKNEIYFVTDSHWNYFGAYRAYREVIAYLQNYYPTMKPIPENEMELTYVDAQNMGLAVISRLQGIATEPPVPMYDKTDGWNWRSVEELANYADPAHPDRYGSTVDMIIRENDSNTNMPNIMVLADSFAGVKNGINYWDVNAFFSESVHRYVRYHYYMGAPRMDLVEEENSDVVMQLLVGSSIYHRVADPLQGTCHKGQKISFAADAADTSMVFYDGLSNREEQFTWFDGDVAQAWFFLADYDGGAVNIDMTLAGSYLQAYDHQILDFTINDQYTERILVEAADTEISLVVPEEYCDEGDIHMRIDFPNAEYTPGMERKLSVALSSMTLY